MRDMTKTLIAWAYEPSDFFEAATTLELPECTLSIDNGRATCEFGGGYTGDARSQLDTAQARVQAVFLARSLVTGHTYKLTHTDFVQLDTEGRRHITVFPEPIVMAIRLGTIDVTITDRHGHVKTDTRATRIGSETAYVESLAAKVNRSPTLARMVASYYQSLHDPGNSLVYLYEIRDAAVKHFGTSKAAKSALEVSDADWSRLGRLANDEPIRQGRHRGGSNAPLRDVTTDELHDVRSITKRMIEAFAASI